MSTKIYFARRFPAKRLHDFIDHVDKYMFGKAVEQTRKLMTAVKASELEKKVNAFYKSVKRDPKKEKKSLVERIRKIEAYNMVMDNLLKKYAAEARRVVGLQLDCGWSFWLHNGKFYGIPYGDWWMYEKLQFPKWAEDFSYWNNTDPPDGKTWKQWNARGRVWDKICTGKSLSRHRSHHNAFRLQHEIVNLQKGHSVPSEVRLQMSVAPVC